MTMVVLTDLDRTLTGPDLKIDERALERVGELRARGVAVVIVTGRPMTYLLVHGLDRACDALVAENGGIVSIPSRRVFDVREPSFVDRARRALGPLAKQFGWGRVLASGPRELAREATTLLSEHSVPHSVSFNAEEVMLLPPRVDKASGALRVLDRLGARPETAWAIGDGENDEPMLRLVGRSAAPANAVPLARAAARVQLRGAYADGFLEFTAPLLETVSVPVQRMVPVQGAPPTDARATTASAATLSGDGPAPGP